MHTDVAGFEAAVANPWRQNLQEYADAWASSWYLPVSQAWQATIALAAYWPATHVVHTAGATVF